jgi:hypothetical protein
MANTLHIPQGLTLAVEDGKVALIAEGDVIVEGPLSGDISRIESTQGTITLRGPVSADRVVAQGVRIEGHLQCQELVAHSGAIQMRGRLDAESVVATQGDIVVRGPTQVGVMRAGGTLRVDGPRIEARLLQGDLVRFRGGTIKARGIEAQSRVSLGPCAFTVEVCIAPHAEVDPKAAGRINVLESHNELGNNALKGRFRLQEYAEFTGVDPEAFLREREVRPLAELGAAQLSAAEGEGSGLGELDLRTADEPTDHGLVGLVEPLPPQPKPPVREAPTPQPATPQSTPAQSATEAADEAPTMHMANAQALLEQAGLAPRPAAETPQPSPPEIEEPQPLAEEPEPVDFDDLEEFHDIEPFDAPPEQPLESLAEPAPPQESDELEEIEDFEEIEEFEELPAPPSATPRRDAALADTLSGDETNSDTLTPPDEPTLELSPETQSFLNQSVARLAKHYAGGEPPAISRLRALVSSQDYALVRDELKDLFNSVVRGHIATGTRPHPQVLSDFNAIHDVMKRA